MIYLAIKFALTAAIVVAISEIGKRSSFLGALLASLPLTSILAILWLYAETGDRDKIASLSTGIFWLVIPSLVLFLALPALLARGMEFYSSLAISAALTVVAYLAMSFALNRFGISI